ncbi:centromere protein F isoform X2 [Ascaphus truei]|uniref:centromere protein F isoform X2 n=1 Tax=Ascaphus truei TaxID=8439 RepID=UPI003F5A0C37
MSWVVDEWKEGLPTKSLQKIQELESQLDKLKKERQQRQFQLESLEAAFQKQKQKVESEKSEATALKRENQSLLELCGSHEKIKQKLTHDHQVKESQVNFLEGQLISSKKQIEKLEQELKRYKNDLEKSQQSFNAGDTSLCATPQKSFIAPYTPTKYNDSKYEELQDKYNKEVEERKRLEAELKMLQFKKVNQPPQPPSQSTLNHRDIARHQCSSSVFSWQQEQTSSRSSSRSHDTSLKRSFASTQCPWEQEVTPCKKGFQTENSSNSLGDSTNTQANEQLRVQNQELQSKINEMSIRLQVQEKDLKTQLNKLQDTQKMLEKIQMELAEKDKTVTKSRDDLARMTMQFDQSTDKCVLAEQKLKKVSEELSCQRQNAESARIAVEQKLKDREKENQQELLRQQNALQNMEQQLNQMKTKLSQESQQAKNDFNALQSELDRGIQGKNLLEREIDELKQKLCRTEQALHTSQGVENDFKRLLEETKTEQNAIKCRYDQKSKEALQLEEEFKTANQTLKQNQLFTEEIKNKKIILEAELQSALEKLQGQDSHGFQSLQATVSNLEKERHLAQELLKKGERDIEETKNALCKLVEESEALKNQFDLKEKECNELINVNVSLSNWKNEHEKAISLVRSENEDLSKKISDTEKLLSAQQYQIQLLENDKKNLHMQIETLQNIVDVKTADLDAQKVAYDECQRKLEAADHQCKQERKNSVLQIADLHGQLEEHKSAGHQTRVLEQALQKEKQLNSEFQIQSVELLKIKEDVQKRLNEVEEMHGRFVADSRSHVESLLNDISSKQNYVDSVASIIQEKEEEISTLSEKLGLKDTDMQCAYKSNEVLKDKVQELNLLSESWSVERETMATLISSNKKDIERLIEENKRIDELNNALNYEKMRLLKTNTDFISHIIHERQQTISELSEGNTDEHPVLLDECNGNAKEFENLKQDIIDLKEKQCNMQNEKEHLLKANEELTTVVHELKHNELSLKKITEELAICLKDKESSLNKVQVQLEMLQMDFDDKEVCMDSISEHVNELEDALKDAQKTVVESSRGKDLVQEELNTLKSQQKTPGSTVTVLEKEQSFDLDLIEMTEECAPNNFLVDSDGNRLVGMNDENTCIQMKIVQPSNNQDSIIIEHSNAISNLDHETPAGHNRLSFQHNCGDMENIVELQSIIKTLKDENSVLLNKLKEITSKPATDSTKYTTDITEQNSELQYQDKCVLDKVAETAHDQHTSPSAVKYSTHQTDNETNDDRQSITGELVAEVHFRKSLEERLQMFTDMKNEDVCELKELIILCQTELNSLRKQHSSEIAKWQQKLRDQAMELETKLAVEKQQTEYLSLELETARLELQSLDLSSRSLLSADCEDLTKTFENTNQSICSALPIGKLSLQNAEPLIQYLNDGQRSPESTNTSEVEKHVNTILTVSLETLTGQKERTNTPKESGECSLASTEDKYSNINTTEPLLDRLEIETIANLNLQVHQTSTETLKLLQHAEEGDKNIQNLILEIKDLNERIGMQQSELNGNEKANTELQNNVKELENDKLHLIGKIELISLEKLQLSCRIGDLEKEHDNLSNRMEMLNVQLSEMSGIREGLQLSNGEWNEKYLETENELRRTKSEKGNIESHALSLEADLDTLQTKYQHLQDENKNNLKYVAVLEERLNVILAEKSLINQELDRLAEEKEELEQMFQHLKEKEKDLESNKVNSRELLKILEAEIRALKVELQAAKSVTEQLSADKDNLRYLQQSEMNTNLQIEELQNQIRQIKEENQLLFKESEDLQTKLNAAYSEKDLLSRSLECCQFEKHEMTGRLSSTQEEVALMRTGIEKLKIRIESDEKKKHHLIGKLKESERKADCLKDKVENLERELLMSEENLEGMILETEAAKEDSEKLKSQKETLEMDLKTFRRKAVDLEQELEKSCEKMLGLEATIVSITNTLENSDMKKNEIKEEADKEVILLQTQLNDLHEQKLLSDKNYEAASAKQVDLIALMDQNKTQLLQQLEEAQVNCRDLEVSFEKLALDLEEGKMKLDEKAQCILLLESKLKDAENWENKYSVEQSRFEIESESLKKEKEVLQIMLDKLETKLQTISITNESFQVTITDLKRSHMDLETQLESSVAEKIAILQKVDERKADCLKDKIENLERELLTSEENLEGMILETEAAKEDSEKLKSQKETLEIDLRTFRKKAVNLEKELEKSHEKMLELEATIVSITNTLENSEMMKNEIKEEADKVVLLLQTQLNDLHEQKVLSDKNYEAASAKQVDLVALIDQNKTQLLQQLEEAQVNCRDLEVSFEKLALDLEACKMKLDEKAQCILLLESKLKDAENWENKYSVELSSFEIERESLKKEKEVLQIMLDKLETKVQTISITNESFQVTITDLKRSHKDLETQLESSATEKNAILQKVGELTENSTSLQRKLLDADLQIKTIEQEITLERESFDGQMQTVKQQNEGQNALLLAATSENAGMKETITKLQIELNMKAQKSKEDLAEYQSRHLHTESNHQALLGELMEQHKGEIQSYQEKLVSVEEHLNAHKHEIDCLKSSNSELNQSLCNAQKQLEEFYKLQVNVELLKKENGTTCNKLNLWIKSCKQMEHEKEQLQKQIMQHEEAFKDLQQKQKNTGMDTSANDLISEIEELKESLEEKTLEADESIDKYCTLIIKFHKLEDANDTLQKQVDLLSSRLKQFETSEEVHSAPQTSDNSLNTSNRKGPKNRRLTQGARKQPGKRQRAQEGTEDNQEQKSATPQRLPKRIKNTVSSGVSKQPATEEDVEIEPDGLPEVVKKGFSDIPSGKKSPFVMRRTALPKRTSPRLAAQRQSPSSLCSPKMNLENLTDFSNPTAEGSKSHMVQWGAGIGTMELSSPLSAYNKLKDTASESPSSNSHMERDRISSKYLQEQSENEEPCNVQ